MSGEHRQDRMFLFKKKHPATIRCRSASCGVTSRAAKYLAFFEKGWGLGRRGKLFFTGKKFFPFPRAFLHTKKRLRQNKCRGAFLHTVKRNLLGKETCGILIEEGGAIRMLLQDAGGAHIGDGAFQSGFDRFGFAQIGHGVDDAGSFHALLDGHGNRLFGHIVDGGEPAFAELLLTAAQFQIDNDVGAFGVEVSRGIVESEVTIFTDTDESNVDGVFGDVLFQFSQSGREVGGSTVDREEGGRGNRKFGDEAFPEIFPEAGRMVDVQTDIFVEVEELDDAPVDIFFFEEGGEHFKLAGSGGEDHVGVTLGGDGGTNFFGAEFGSVFAKLILVVVDFYIHFFFSCIRLDVVIAVG